jgi:hypothetical protein
MLQYRLSTLFLIFFFVAATMALFGMWGIWIAGVLFLAAICVNQVRTVMKGIAATVLISLGVFIFGLPTFYQSEAGQHRLCVDKMDQLGLGLLNYHCFHKHFPPVYSCDIYNNSMFSWVVPLLPNIDCETEFYQLKKDEPWDSPHNKQFLSQTSLPTFHCPGANQKNEVDIINYIAIIGPGTIWRKEGTVDFWDLPQGGLSVMLVEAATSDKHWAEPFALTAEEVLENMKSGKGVRISSGHPSGVYVLFTNGKVDFLPAEMPLSLWKKILAGEVPAKDLDDINSLIDPNAPDMVNVYVSTPKTNPWPFILGVIVWLVSIALLFRRAVKSRRKPEIETVEPPAAS